MLICNGCGEKFTESEIRWERDEYGEWEARCPHCDWGVPEDAKTCRICGEDFCEDDLIEGFCPDCLDNALTLESFLEFAVDGFNEYECSLFEEFMFTKMFGWDYDDVPNCSTPLFRKALETIYRQETVSVYADTLMDRIRDFMKMYKPEFAEYLSVKEAKKCTKQETEKTP